MNSVYSHTLKPRAEESGFRFVMLFLSDFPQWVENDKQLFLQTSRQCGRAALVTTFPEIRNCIPGCCSKRTVKAFLTSGQIEDLVLGVA